MNHSEQQVSAAGIPESGPSAKKPYQKPDVRHERVFETMAMACGKVQTTQPSCKHGGRKAS